MDVPPEVAVAAMTLAAAAVTHAGRIIYLTIRDHRGETPLTRLSPEQIKQIAEVVAQAVAKRLDGHSSREEQSLQRLLEIDERTVGRLAHIEDSLTRLVTIYDLTARHRDEQHRNMIDRLSTIESQLRERRAA